MGHAAVLLELAARRSVTGRAEQDSDGDADVEVLVDGISKSLKVLKRLAAHARDHKQMWEAEFDFCEELEAKYKARETEL
ncbi:hypothetical protein Taro_045165 [Colocasia esculenta]|uniref:Uncharacterized protein n=1 Tax=Colocasia esculenta TaxID=4460 RepID=A0A843WQI3_COLES|nr:hypothetical protein [Colocasia esculenta]